MIIKKYNHKERVFKINVEFESNPHKKNKYKIKFNIVTCMKVTGETFSFV